jgi:O-antigen ligase
MILVKQLQNFALYLYFFFVNFQELSFFGLNNFSIPKFTVIIYLGTIAIQHRDYIRISNLKKIMGPIVAFFGLLIIVNLFNINNLSARFFDFAIFQNIILFWILINHGRKDIRAFEKALLILALGSIVLAFFYNAGIGVEFQEVYGVTRVSLFGDNSNITSIRMVISILIITAAVVQDRLRIGLYRFLLLIPIIIMINLMAETGSRVGFISLALAFIVGILFYKAKNNWNKIFVIIAGSLSFSLFLTFILKSEMLVLRLLKIVVDNDLAGRDYIWENIITVIQSNFIFGIGQTGYFSIFGLGSPHNVFLEVLIYTGIIGLVLYLIFILRISIYAYKLLKIKRLILPLLLMSPIFGILFSGQILTMKLGWIVMAYIVSVYLNEFSVSLTKNNKSNLNVGVEK